jgi:hypothetical protein
MKCNLFFLLEAQWAEPVSLTFHSASEEINQPMMVSEAHIQQVSQDVSDDHCNMNYKQIL